MVFAAFVVVVAVPELSTQEYSIGFIFSGPENTHEVLSAAHAGAEVFAVMSVLICTTFVSLVHKFV